MVSSKSKTVYLCSACGEDFPKWNGQCPKCREWGTLSEYRVRKDRSRPKNQTAREYTNLTEIIDRGPEQRIKTGLREVDRVLGGGLLEGSLVLLGGNPGVGKSTLALQLVPNLKKTVLYVSAEESEDQIALRSRRLGIQTKDLYLSAENNIQGILDQITLVKPKVVVIDSIQTVYSDSLDSLPGSASQIRECGQQFLQTAKIHTIAVIMIGHVTKEGMIAGPKMLEHMVDTVLYLEGEERHDHRILRSVKNRFGTTNEVGIFHMGAKGLEEVTNPSEIFLAERQDEISGSTIFPSIEGTRPILVEVQALVSKANFGTPQRNVNGFDFKRLSMLLAVLEKRVGVLMGTSDVFVNLVGGLKVDDPAADLAVISAVASSAKNAVIPAGVVLVGEVGLGGEIRSVSHFEKRVREAASLGFDKLLAPAVNVKRLRKQKGQPLTLIPVNTVPEAFSRLF
jgi:DNA repair protein RadA/Sms